MSSSASASDAYPFATFLAEHEAQLRHFRVPAALYPRVYAKLAQQIFDAGSVFMFGEIESDAGSGAAKLGVFTAEGVELEAESDVFLIDHAWTFRSKAQAREQLLASRPLLDRMCALMSLPEVGDDDADADAIAAAADAVIGNLYRFGWQYEFVGDAEAEEAAAGAGASASSSAAGGSADDEESSFAIRSTSRNVYYYVNDEVGSRFADAFPKETASASGKGSADDAEDDDDDDDEHVANFALVPLFFVPQQVAYTLCWPLRRVGEFARCRHAARLPLNDFSRMEYWDARFKVEGQQIAYDWYFDFSTVKDRTFWIKCAGLFELHSDLLCQYYIICTLIIIEFGVLQCSHSRAISIRSRWSRPRLPPVPVPPRPRLARRCCAPTRASSWSAAATRHSRQTCTTPGSPTLRMSIMPRQSLSRCELVQTCRENFLKIVLCSSRHMSLALFWSIAVFCFQFVPSLYLSPLHSQYHPHLQSQMRVKYADRPRMRWAVGDVTDLCAYADDAFDTVIDKGCLDAILDGQDEALAVRALTEQRRVLSAPDARFVLISLGGPATRLPVLEVYIEPIHVFG